VSNDAPKSAYELAMERLRRRDADQGGGDTLPLTEAQKASIAETRRVCEAKLAELEILHRSGMKAATDPDAAEEAGAQYARDRERAIAERDRRIEEIRRG
jgi:hypothetical protein